MEKWLQLIALVLSIIGGFISLWAGIKKMLSKQYEKLKKRQDDIEKMSKFQGKVSMTMIRILCGEKINGQVLKLQKEAEEFYIDC